MVDPDVPALPVTDLAAFRERRGTPGAGDRPPGGPLPQGTVTFLLAEAEGARGEWDAVAGFRGVLEAAVAAHHGVCPVEHGGATLFVAAFDLASDAAAAALAAQRELGRAAVRMALHTGDAQIADGRYSAVAAISRCARLRALGHAGQILVSGTAADVLADGLPPGVGLLPLGEHRLRGLQRPLRVFQLAHPDLRALFPPLRSLDTLPTNLPAPLTGFVGRVNERAELIVLLAEHRLVTLAGPGGSGKTRLAAQSAADVADGFPDGVWWVDLAPVADPAMVPWVVLAALGLGDDRGLDPVERIVGYLAAGRVLLLFDNCEHVLGPTSTAVDRLLRACPAVAVLATSREPLGVPGEVVHRVEPLSESESVELFVERALEARPAFSLDESNAPVVTAICARVDGLPLAVELAAARIRALTPERVLAGLDDRFRLLTGGTDGLGRPQTLQASMEWSHDLLTPPEQAVLRRLAVCSGRFDVDAAEAVATDGDVQAWEVVGLLGDLVDKSLVRFDGERYGLLQTVQAFAAARLLEAEETAATRDRHAAHFLARAEAAAALLSRELRPHLLAALELDHDNLRAALEWSTTASDPEHDDLALRLVVALAFFWHLHGHFAEGLAWHRRVLARVPQDASAMRCRAISGLGHLSLNCMELGNGLGLDELTEAVSLARRLNEPGLASRPLAALGATQAFGHPGDPAATLGEAIAAARGSGDGWDLWCALWWQGFYRVYTRNRPAEAGPVLAELDAISRRSENDSCRGWDDIIRLLAAWQDGRAADARATMDAVLRRAYRSNDPLLESHAVLFGADSLIALGEYAEAEALGMRTALRLRRSLDACRQGFVEFGLARLALARGDLEEATRQADVLDGVLRRTGLPLMIQWLALLRGRVALERGDLAVARAAIDEAASTAESTGIPWDVAGARHHQGLLALAEKDHRAAADRLRQALVIDVEHGFRGRATDTLEAFAAVAAAVGKAPEAARLIGAADALRDATGMVRRPLDAPAYASAAARVQASLGDEAFARLRAEGAKWGLREAAEYAFGITFPT
jgi:predicted ATPase